MLTIGELREVFAPFPAFLFYCYQVVFDNKFDFIRFFNHIQNIRKIGVPLQIPGKLNFFCPLI